jgi:hypothetical protein
MKLVLRADAFDVLKNSCAARAHQLDRAAISESSKRDHRLDRVRGLERDIVEDQCRRTFLDRLAHGSAVGKFDRIDARPMQHQRQEMPYA